MMKAAVLLLVGLVLVSAYTEQEYQTAFTSWMHTHGKTYTGNEFQNRYTIFKSNMDYARDWNAVNKDTVLGMTHLADLTNAEYQKIFLGTKIDGTARLAAAKDVQVTVSDNYNATVDWRTKNVVSPIKNQGQCGSCWSFSTTGSTEGAHALATGNLVSLSEQNLMDCSTSYGNNGCDGGLMDYAFQYIVANKGIDTEESYPYQGVQGTCNYVAANSGATISSYTDVTAGSETALATAVQQQPVSVAIDASHTSFQLYTSGIYHDIFCSATRLDHGVLAVGFGTDTTSKQNYWIVKNSWGTSWGQAGFIYMSKDRNNNCGIATSASYPKV
jgi:cathepsin L